MRPPIIGVIGGGSRHVPEDSPVFRQAFDVGRAIASCGGIMLCGGRGGVMRAAALGVRSAGGHSVGILPDDGPTEAEYAVATGMGDGRNYLNAYVSDALIALFGEAGTLSEISLAMKIGRPVIYFDHWSFLNDAGLPQMPLTHNAGEAVTLALSSLGLAPGERLARPVQLPIVRDQTEHLQRLADWVNNV